MLGINTLVNTKSASGQFAFFAGAHSFLIGLLPFYLPVLVWEQSHSFVYLCLFISLTGAGFVLSLKVWQAWRTSNKWRLIIFSSFLLELLIVVAMMTRPQGYPLVLLGLLNGAYACFYWTTQRVMFNAFTREENSGKHFGNFQIIVAIMLKVGIFTGGLLLEHKLMFWLLAGSLLSAILFYYLIGAPAKELSRQSGGPSSKVEICPKTASVFLIDGVFLYMESYFWILSLYIVLKESFSTLGFVVVFLTIALSLLFWVIRKYIDRYNLPRVFYIAVFCYFCSWLLRAWVDEDFPELALYVSVALVAFFTAYFRLVFNKRFFDVAKQENPEQYIVIKSYMSQWGLIITFALAAIASVWWLEADRALLNQLNNFYLFLAPVSLLYLLYESVGQKKLQGQYNVKTFNADTKS